MARLSSPSTERVFTESKTFPNLGHRRGAFRNFILQLNASRELVLLALHGQQDFLQWRVALAPWNVLPPVDAELSVLEMETSDPVMMLFNERNRRLAHGGSVVADIEINSVVFRLGERRVPAIKVNLGVIVVAHHHLVLGGNGADSCRKFRIPGEFGRDLVCAESSSGVEEIIELCIRCIGGQDS